MRLAASPNSGDGKLSLQAEDGISAVVQADLAGVLHTRISCLMATLHYLCYERPSTVRTPSPYGPPVGFIDWQWLQALRTTQRMGQVSGVRLEVACANALMPAQYQQTDRLLAQLWGCRRVLLFGPDQVRPRCLGIEAGPILQAWHVNAAWSPRSERMLTKGADSTVLTAGIQRPSAIPCAPRMRWVCNGGPGAAGPADVARRCATCRALCDPRSGRRSLCAALLVIGWQRHSELDAAAEPAFLTV